MYVIYATVAAGHLLLRACSSQNGSKRHRLSGRKKDRENMAFCVNSMYTDFFFFLNMYGEATVKTFPKNFQRKVV